MAEIFRKVEAGEVIMIISQGREVAKLVPPDNEMEKARRMLEELRKTAVVGDVLSPVAEEWEAMK
jgi:antitoxin (DNA-binding transcriptional repressor) of toxin-antitoxin stability system